MRWKKRKKKSLHRIRDLTVISTLHGSLSEKNAMEEKKEKVITSDS
jgi:hypothetical protein